MAFPVTLNGRTYTLADFEGNNYVDGLPDAFEDFVTQAGNIYTTTSTSSVAIGTGSKTFTVADSGKPYIVGTPLRIADTAAPSTNWIDGIVTAYSGTTLTVNAVAYAGSGTKTAWSINIGGGPIAYTGTLPVAQGGTGATTAADARTNLDTYSKAEADSRFLNVSGEASDVVINGSLTVDTDTLFVDDDNNRVGFGTTTPQTNVHVSDSGDTGIQITKEGSVSARIKTVSGALVVGVDGSNGDTERYRVDTSGNLLVGKTATGYNDAAGVELHSTGFSAFTRSDAVVAYFNRKGSNGDHVQFLKDGSAAGSIGSHAGFFTLGNGDTSLIFDSNSNTIEPFNQNDRTSEDAAITLGWSTNRFKDLYLSGKINYGADVTSGNGGLNVQSINTFNDNNNNAVGSLNGGFTVLLLSQGSGSIVLPFFQNAGGGVAWSGSLFDPDAGSFVYGSGPTVTFTPAGTNANTYQVQMIGGTGTCYVMRTSGSQAYTAAICTLLY